MRPGSCGYTTAIVVAQVLTQIGAFTLPALLPGYMEAWALTATAAGWRFGTHDTGLPPGQALMCLHGVLAG